MNDTRRARADASGDPGAPAPHDEVRRFLIERQPVRGHWVHLGPAWRDLRAHLDYPPVVRDLLGEAVASAVLLAATLKFHGTLTLQFEGDGRVRLLVAQCTHDFGVRAVARFEAADFADGDAEMLDFRALVGQRGRVIVTIEATERDLRYQGIVPLAGESLAESLEEYFATSEQLPTRVRLAADGENSVGLLIQRLPQASADAGEAWEGAQRGIAGLSAKDLLSESFETLVRGVLGEQDVRVFRGTPVRSECRCNAERVSALLRAIGEAEVADVIREQGSVTVTCEFCQRPYRFSEADAKALFGSGMTPPGSGALH